MHRNFMVASGRVVHPGFPSSTAEVGPWFLIDAGRGGSELNGAIVATEASPDDLAVAEEWFAERGSRCMLRLRRDADDELISTVLERGYAINRREPALYQDSPEPPDYEGPLEIIEITDIEQLERFLASGRAPPLNEFADAMSWKELSIPGFAQYFGVVDCRMVGAVSCLTTESIVGVFALGVEDAYRRRGFGAALTWAAVAGGLRRVATSALLGSTEMSHAMYERMGFSTL